MILGLGQRSLSREGRGQSSILGGELEGRELPSLEGETEALLMT